MKSKLVAIILLFSICFTGLAGCDSGGGSSARIETAVATEVPATMEAVEIPDPDAYHPPDIYTENEFASEWLNLRYTPPAGMHCNVEVDNYYNSTSKDGRDSRYEMDFYDSPSNKKLGVAIITNLLNGSSLEEECERTKQGIPSGEVYGFYIKITWEPDRDFTFLGETYRLLTYSTKTYLNSVLQRQGTQWQLLRVKGDRLITIFCCAYQTSETLDDLLAPFSTYDGTESYHPENLSVSRVTSEQVYERARAAYAAAGVDDLSSLTPSSGEKQSFSCLLGYYKTNVHNEGGYVKAVLTQCSDPLVLGMAYSSKDSFATLLEMLSIPPFSVDENVDRQSLLLELGNAETSVDSANNTQYLLNKGDWCYSLILSASQDAITIGAMYLSEENISNGSSATSNPALSAQVEIGGTITFGSYEQDNNTSNGKEDIEWLVLDKQGNQALIVSRYALDCQLYHPSMDNVTWESCSLRMWLNDTFYYSAFSADEQRIIQSAAAHTSWDDKVFLLSTGEVDMYFPSDSAMTCRGTAYCYAQGAYVGANDNCWWWLRSPGNRSGSAMNVGSNGTVNYNGNDVDACAGAVRPAMWITIG